jgi:hypothetical protein
MIIMKNLFSGVASFDPADPFGVCQMNFSGVHICNNIEHSKGIWTFLLIGLGIVAAFFADFFDPFSWLVGWIPVIGDILGNAVIGNIIDGIAMVAMLLLVGNFALIGVTEFIDILGFIPGIGDMIAFIEFLPAWTSVLVMYGIWMLIKMIFGLGKKETQVKPLVQQV